MAKPILAILTDSVRFDNQHPLKYFKKFQVVHFYRSAPYGDLKKEDLKDGIKWKDLEDLEGKLLKLKPDLIQGAEPYASKVALDICLLTMKVSRLLNVPYFFPMWENRPVKERFGIIAGTVMKKILKRYAGNASLIFNLNYGAKKNLLEVGIKPEKIVKMPYGFFGIDQKIFRPGIKTKRFTLHPSPYILFVGRLDEAKGISYLIEAWDIIKKDFPKVDFVFVGKGQLEDRVIGEQVKRLDWMKTQDLPPYFANALFSVYPSVTLPRWEEQVGTVNLQSLACGTPVITTKSGAIPEYITSEVGILVPERDSKALAKAMKKLLKDAKLRQKLGKNGIRYIKENFDIAKNIRKIEEILSVLI